MAVHDMEETVGVIDRERTKVHALVLMHRNRVGLVSLSKDYSFALSKTLAPSSQEEPVIVSIEAIEPKRILISSIPVESLTILYGENGSGKTHAMIEACGSLSSVSGERKLATVWERDGQLYLDPGSLLKQRLIAVHQGEILPALKIDEPLGVAFYTTSPFEASKRRSLRSKGTIDVTPTFNPSNPFEGGALLRAYTKLPTDFAFIPDATVRLQVRVPSLRFALDQILPSLRKRNKKTVSDIQRRALARLDQLLDPLESRAFAIQLLIMSRQSVSRSLDFLLRIAQESGLIDLPGEVNADVKARLRERVSQVINEPLYDDPRFISSNFNTAQMLANFLDIELPALTRQLGKKTTLGALATEMSGLSQTSWEHLDQASRLGFTRWSFRDLSSGQVALLLVFSSLASALAQLPKKNTTFLFIDEGEMFMHPAWQRRYITDLLSFLGKFEALAPHMHLVLATHSLIVAADAPPNRLYDVGSGEMKNGFGYGPKDLLDNVYGVSEFHGEHASNLIATIADHVGKTGSFTESTDDALTLAGSIADKRLRSYLVKELGKLAHRQDAYGDES